MIGNYGRNPYAGRVGGKRNKSIYTISPKTGVINIAKQVGGTKKAKSIGISRVSEKAGVTRKT